MNNKTYSIIAIISRIGKLIGALLSIIGFIVFVSTLTELFSFSTRALSNFAYGSSSSSATAIGYAQTLMGALNCMHVGAILLFICALSSVVFNILAKENIVGSGIDAALALVSFIMSFSLDVMSAAQDMMMGGGDQAAIIDTGINLVKALIFVLLIAILSVRAVLPTDSIITRIKNGFSAAPKTAYAPNAFAPNMNHAYPQANQAYSPNQAYPQANQAYNPNQTYPQANQAYNPNQAYPQNANQAYNPNQAYPQGANQAYNPNQAYPQGANQAYNPNPAYPQNANQQFNPNPAYPQNANPQNPAGGYYQNNNRM